MIEDRTKVSFNTGNLLEIAGAAMGTTAVYLLSGLAWALVCGAVLLILAAELIYVAPTTVRLPGLPRPKNPHLIQRWKLHRTVQEYKRSIAAQVAIQEEESK